MKDDVTLQIFDWLKRVISSCTTKEHLDGAFELLKLYKKKYDPAMNVWMNLNNHFLEHELKIEKGEVHS